MTGMGAEQRWRRIRGFNDLAKVIDEAKFRDGIQLNSNTGHRRASPDHAVHQNSLQAHPKLVQAEGRLSKSAAFCRDPPENKTFRNEKGQPERVGLVVLVEAAGIEPASASPPPSALHA